MTKSDLPDNTIKEYSVITILLPPLGGGKLFEFHSELRAVLDKLDEYKLDFRILGNKGEKGVNGDMGYKRGGLEPTAVGERTSP